MSTALFQVISDIHLETRVSYDISLRQTAPNLALLGDIGHVADSKLFRFLEKQLRRYWTVFFLLGNHEPTSTSWPQAKRTVQQFAERMESLRQRSTMGRFVFLDQRRYDINDRLTVLGCTLFSAVTEEQRSAVASRFVDFRTILQWDIQDHLDAHWADRRWLNAQVAAIVAAEPQRKVVVLTHHSPTVDERAVEAQQRDSAVSSGFATDLRRDECWTNPAVVLWAFGHTHYNCDFVDDDTGKRVLANQLGYAASPVTTFDGSKTVLLE